MTVKLKGDKITVPKLCPFNSGEPEWKILPNKTDQQKLKSLLKNFGVEFVENTLGITCHKGSRKVTGYNCFYTVFVFDENERFEEMGAYE